MPTKAVLLRQEKVIFQMEKTLFTKLATLEQLGYCFLDFLTCDLRAKICMHVR